MAKPAPVAAALAFMLTACGGPGSRSTRHLAPIPPQTLALMAEKGMSPSDPILMRAYKEESELEVWKRRADGKYARLKTFPICRWSGRRAEDQAGRPPGARGVLHRHALPR